MPVWFIVLFALLMAGIIASLIALFILQGQKKTTGTPGPQGASGETGFDGPRGPQGFIGFQGSSSGGGGAGSPGTVDSIWTVLPYFSIRAEDATSFDEGGTEQNRGFTTALDIFHGRPGIVNSSITLSAHIAVYMQNPDNNQARFRITLAFPLATQNLPALTNSPILSFVGYMFTQSGGTTGSPILLVNVLVQDSITIILSFFQTTGSIWNNTGNAPKLDTYFSLTYLTPNSNV